MSHYSANLRSSSVALPIPMPTSWVRGLSEITGGKFLATLESRGRATIEIAVSVTQNEIEIFAGIFKWFAAAK